MSDRQLVDLAAGSVSLRRWGDGGPEVVLVHGLSQSGRLFDRVAPLLAGSSLRVVVPDMPGHGDTGRAADPGLAYTIDGQGRVLAELVGALGLQRPVVVGVSMGGHWALSAVRQGAVPGALVLATCAPLAGPADLARAFRPNPALGVVFSERPDEDAFRAFAEALFRDGADVLEEDFRRADPAHRRVMGEAIGTGKLPDELTCVAPSGVPVALVLGEHEPLIEPAHVRSLRIAGLWRDEVQVIRGATHFLPFDRPDAFARLVLEVVADRADAEG